MIRNILLSVICVTLPLSTFGQCTLSPTLLTEAYVRSCGGAVFNKRLVGFSDPGINNPGGIRTVAGTESAEGLIIEVWTQRAWMAWPKDSLDKGWAERMTKLSPPEKWPMRAKKNSVETYYLHRRSVSYCETIVGRMLLFATSSKCCDTVPGRESCIVPVTEVHVLENTSDFVPSTDASN